MYNKTYNTGDKMNILITIDNGYLDVRCVMLKSLLLCHPDTEFTVYVLNSSLNSEDFAAMKQSLPSKRMTIVDVKAGKDLLADAPVTERYPKEMYYRIFAAAFLPDNVDRVLYLDPDLVVIKPLYNLYSIDLDGFYFAAASHVGKFLTNLNALRLQTEENTPYINSGVMMINISLLRKEISVFLITRLPLGQIRQRRQKHGCETDRHHTADQSFDLLLHALLPLRTENR